MIAQLRRARPPGWWIPWTFVGLFLVVVAVNATMIWLALGSFSGLVAERPYDLGLTYNRNLEAAAAQAELGWSLEVIAELAAPAVATLEVRLTDRDGLPLTGAVLDASLVRPLGAGEEVPLAFTPAIAGRYRATAALPQPGVWDLRVRVERDDERFMTEERLFLH